MLRQKLRSLRHALTGAPIAYRPGHFYSPICCPLEIAELSFSLDLVGIDLNDANQVARWKAWQSFLPATHWRHYTTDLSVNREFGLPDAICLYGFLRELKPRKLIEIGCGYSSACALDTIEAFNLPTVCTFIDPFPTRLPSLLAKKKLIEKPVQQVSLALFQELDAEDILFIDSTHVLKTGSDVHYELFEILPRLKSGVFVHFHDVCFPFEYPKEISVTRNYSWNEAYGLRALLMHTNRYRIEFWNSYLTHLGVADFGTCGCLWISVT
jgi:Methyltransferase domain